MKTTTNLKWRLLVTFTTIAFGIGMQEVNAQSGGAMFTLQSTFSIGGRVNAVKFIESSQTPLMAIGTQSESNGWVEIRNVTTGNVVKTINTNAAVFSIASSSSIPYIAVGTIYGANVFGLQNNKNIRLQTVGRGVIVSILWIEGAGNAKPQIVVGDQDGNISFFKLDTNSNYLNAYKTIPYPVNPALQIRNPSVVSLNFTGNVITAGYVNQVAAWDTNGWVRKFQVSEPVGPNRNGRAMQVTDMSTLLITSDRDSIQAYDFDGALKYRVPFFAGDSPVEMALGAEGFSFVAIGTTWDRCLVYKIDGNTASYIGNFSNHTFTVSAVDIRAYIGVGYLMATGSGDKTVEIWKYNTNYRP